MTGEFGKVTKGIVNQSVNDIINIIEQRNHENEGGSLQMFISIYCVWKNEVFDLLNELNWNNSLIVGIIFMWF